MSRNQEECLGSKVIKDDEIKCSVEMNKKVRYFCFKETVLLEWTQTSFEH